MKRLLSVAVLATLGALIGCSESKLPYLTTIQINPATPSVAAGQTQQFTAQGTFSNGVTQDLSSLVTWSGSPATVGTINSSGLAQTYTEGTFTISASYTIPSGPVTGTNAVTVTAPALVSVFVTDLVADTSTLYPSPRSVNTATASTALGTSHQFIAFGVFTDGGVRNITNTVAWTATPSADATITSAGRATGIGPQTATVTATDPTTSLSGSASLVVTNANLDAIVVSPAAQTMAPLTRIVFSALGQFSDGTTQDMTYDATWSSTNPAAATVSNATPPTPNGVATGVAAGLTAIQATFGTKTGQSALIVSPASLTSIALTPATAGVAIGSTLPLNAVGTFSDGTTQPINLAVAWSVTPNDGSLATVDPTGLVTGVAAGSAMVTAKFGTITQSAVINVQNLTSIAITPPGPSACTGSSCTVTFAQGTLSRLIATATLADGTTQDVSSSVTWLSTKPAVAAVSDGLGSSGWLTGNTPGTATIGAVFDGQYSLATANVTSATLTTLAITPTAPQTIALGTWEQYTATGTFSDSSTQDLSNQVTWSSSSPAVAVVNGLGLATSTGLGTTTVMAAGNINGNTATSQVDLTVAAVVVTPH